jgi:hypothetical protein
MTGAMFVRVIRPGLQHIRASQEKLRRVFGASPEASLSEGLARMVEWVRQHGARTSPSYKGLEIDRNLPESWRTR